MILMNAIPTDIDGDRAMTPAEGLLLITEVKKKRNARDDSSSEGSIKGLAVDVKRAASEEIQLS